MHLSEHSSLNEVILRMSLKSLALALVVNILLVDFAAGETGEFNRRATATAQILAGIVPPAGDPTLDRLVKLEAFAEHQKWMNSRWSQARSRISAIESWRAKELKISGAHNKTLLYPFSGPDFFNPYALFPDHPLYIFFSLERPGTLPDLESISPVQFAKMLQDVRSAFRDIFERMYVSRAYMSKQLATLWIRGAVPLMARMMALMNLRIVRIEPVDLYPELTNTYEAMEANRPRRLMRGVRIYFSSAAEGSLHQWYYFSLESADKWLEFYTG